MRPDLARNLHRLHWGSPASATYAVEPAGHIASGEVRVTATATLEGATAKVRRAYTVSCGITGAVPAALTSRPAIRVSGDAQILSETFAPNSSGLIPRDFPANALTTAAESKDLPIDANNPHFDLQVADANLIPTGAYVQLQVDAQNPDLVETFKVKSKSGNTLTLTRLSQFSTPAPYPAGPSWPWWSTGWRTTRPTATPAPSPSTTSGGWWWASVSPWATTWAR